MLHVTPSGAIPTGTAHNRKALRFPQVQAKTNLSKTHIYRLILRGDFPAPHKLSERVSAWDEAAIDS